MKKEEIENKIEKIRLEIEKLRLEISDEEIKLKFINEVGVDNFDENQFKAYKVLQTIKSDLSDVDKLKIIADLMIEPNEPCKYPKELINLWNELTKNIVVEHRDGNIFFYDTIKNEVVMENRKSYSVCRYKGFWSEFKNVFDLNTDIQEFIQYMMWNTFKLRVNTSAELIISKCYNVWDTFKLRINIPNIN